MIFVLFRCQEIQVCQHFQKVTICSNGWEHLLDQKEQYVHKSTTDKLLF